MRSYFDKKAGFLKINGRKGVWWLVASGLWLVASDLYFIANAGLEVSLLNGLFFVAFYAEICFFKRERREIQVVL